MGHWARGERIYRFEAVFNYTVEDDNTTLGQMSKQSVST